MRKPPQDPNSPKQDFPPDVTVAAEICARLAKGETLLAILDTRPRPDHYPCRVTFYDWLRNDQQIAEMYDKARAAGLDVLAEDCVRIAEDEIDKVEGKRDPAHIAHQKLRIDTRLRLLSKWSPKKYGDRMELRGDAEAPVVMTVENKIPVAEIVAALREAKRKAAE